jgi:hypothetical protein
MEDVLGVTTFSITELDLTQNLVGQAAFFDFNWCAFLFDGCVAPAPGGVDVFTIDVRSRGSPPGLLFVRERSRYSHRYAAQERAGSAHGQARSYRGEFLHDIARPSDMRSHPIAKRFARPTRPFANCSITPASQQMDIRICRSINCGRDAHDGDPYCPRCRQEIDALHGMARRRFVIFGTSAEKRAAGILRRGYRKPFR